MAIKGAARWKPDVYRTSLESTVIELDPAASPPSGIVVMIAQLVVYDDTVVTPANYLAGDPATERNITVLFEQPVSKALGPFTAMTGAQALAEWDAALSTFAAWVQPAGVVLVRAIRNARRSAPITVTG